MKHYRPNSIRAKGLRRTLEERGIDYDMFTRTADRYYDEDNDEYIHGALTVLSRLFSADPDHPIHPVTIKKLLEQYDFERKGGYADNGSM